MKFKIGDIVELTDDGYIIYTFYNNITINTLYKINRFTYNYKAVYCSPLTSPQLDYYFNIDDIKFEKSYYRKEKLKQLRK